MTWLVTSDLHLSDRPKDAYRFGLFPWLARQQALHGVTATYILGDLTDSKDKHSSALVNRLVDELIGLQPPIYILRGNHDGLDPANPYFRFLSTIEGVTFVVEPTLIDGVAFIPHCRTQKEFDRACGIIPPQALLVCCHNTFTGAIGENGTRLAGLGAALVAQAGPRRAYSGDVHRPQVSGPITYVGSPYPVRFGDDYTARVLLIKKDREQNLFYPAPHKWSLTVRDEDDILNDEDLRQGDQVKLTIEMLREESVEWVAHKQRVLTACKERGLEVYGVELKVQTPATQERTTLKAVKSPGEVLDAFCQAEELAAEIKRAGKGLLSL